MHLEFSEIIQQNPDYVKKFCRGNNPINYACRG